MPTLLVALEVVDSVGKIDITTPFACQWLIFCEVIITSWYNSLAPNRPQAIICYIYSSLEGSLVTIPQITWTHMVPWVLTLLDDIRIWENMPCKCQATVMTLHCRMISCDILLWKKRNRRQYANQIWWNSLQLHISLFRENSCCHQLPRTHEQFITWNHITSTYHNIYNFCLLTMKTDHPNWTILNQEKIFSISFSWSYSVLIHNSINSFPMFQFTISHDWPW